MKQKRKWSWCVSRSVSFYIHVSFFLVQAILNVQAFSPVLFSYICIACRKSSLFSLDLITGVLLPGRRLVRRQWEEDTAVGG